MLKNIVIGTANFNQTYGLNSSKVNIKNIKEIINYSKKKKIPLFHWFELPSISIMFWNQNQLPSN